MHSAVCGEVGTLSRLVPSAVPPPPLSSHYPSPRCSVEEPCSLFIMKRLCLKYLQQQGEEGVSIRHDTKQWQK